ncbi:MULTISPECIES: hypothetical protein [Ruminobacter]
MLSISSFESLMVLQISVCQKRFVKADASVDLKTPIRELPSDESGCT